MIDSTKHLARAMSSEKHQPVRAGPFWREHQNAVRA
jgi:hypothetical protein